MSRVLLLLLAALLACDNERAQRPPASQPAVPPDTLLPVADVTCPLGKPERPEHRDRGVGVVAFSPDVHGAATWADTMLLYAGPDTRSGAVARYIFCAPGDYSWSYHVETAGEQPVSNSLEYDYEVEGLPIDSVLPDRSWVRAVYGMAAAGTWLYGWTPVTANRELVFWRDRLPQRDLFAIDEADVDFRSAPDGPKLDFPLVRLGAEYGRRLDYILHPDSAAGAWLRVRAVTPADICVFPQPVVRDTTAWIRYLDAAGRPLVWYFTRGC